MCLLPQSQSST